MVGGLWSVFHFVGGEFLVWSVVFMVGGFYGRCWRWSVSNVVDGRLVMWSVVGVLHFTGRWSVSIFENGRWSVS